MKKQMLIMLIVVGLLFSAVFGFKIYKEHLMTQFIKAQGTPTVTVSAMKVGYDWWKSEASYAASLRAIEGINVTTELGGMVQAIYFKPGSIVQQGTVLVQLNVDSETAQLRALQASADLAKITYNRDLAQFKVNAVSKATVDTDAANVKNTQAQVEQQQAIIAKKTIRAPFTGKLGISEVDLGQYLNPGDGIVKLETFDPIYVDFYVPQQELKRFIVDHPVRLVTDAYPKRIFNGKITTIDSSVDTNTRNILIEATVNNPDYLLIPGMFGTITVNYGSPKQYLTLPQTAISFNSFGNIVFIIEQNGKDQGKPVLIAKQVFVITGKKRGDQITVLKGLQEGQLVVTSGQLKLKNGSVVKINNSVVPSNDPNPIVGNED